MLLIFAGSNHDKRCIEPVNRPFSSQFRHRRYSPNPVATHETVIFGTSVI